MARSFRPVAPNAELSILSDPPEHWHRVAVCTLWSDVHKMRQTYPHAAVVGPLRGRRGVDELVRNLLANRAIRVLVVDGRDIGIGGQALQSIKALWAGNYSALHPMTVGTAESMLRDLVRDVELILVESPGERQQYFMGPIAAALTGRPDREDQVTIAAPPVTVEASAPPGLPGDRVIGMNVADAWTKAMRLILTAGRKVPTQYGETLELQDLVTVITDPTPESARVDMLFGEGATADYHRRVATSECPEGALYTYGSRMTEARIRIEALLKSSPLARAAHITPWQAGDSGLESGRPCLVSLGYRAVPLGGSYELSMRVAFRSHDYWAGYPINLSALSRLLVETAGRLSMETGTLTCMSYSAHLYDRDLEAARELVANFREVGLRMDRRTTWTVARLADGDLQATALTPDGGTVVAVLTGKNPAQLRAKVEQSGLIQEWGNALWLGGEIERVSREG